MSSKVLVLCAALCLVNYCWGDDDTQTQNHLVPRDSDVPGEPLGSSSRLDLDQDASIWRFWQPWKLWRWDSQKTLTRRDSSLIASSTEKRLNSGDDLQSTTRTQSSARLRSDSAYSVLPRPKVPVQKELVTLLFESMLDSIVESWDVIVQHKPEESSPNMNFGRTPSDLASSRKKGKGKETPAKPKSKRSRSKIDVEYSQPEATPSWWTGQDERAQIRFRNGNIYEGNISMKCMHGEGRFQWTNGTVYLGTFKDNEMNGKGRIEWKDDTWYEGEFLGNLRHGHGLYVDSRRQRSYAGGWHCATKHGQGVIYYSKTFRNSYDGEWVHNVRHGYGSREYCENSGYKGDWDYYIREGKGLMIWPNHDFYRGDWKNGVMSGYGFYIWDTYYNNSMSFPSINAFRGQWLKGKRHGYGILNLGIGLGSHYKGEFKNNLKHGVGKFVTNNGLILQHKNLFVDDNLGPIAQEYENVPPDDKNAIRYEPYKFDICDDTVGLIYHIEQALKNFDKQKLIRAAIINEFIENNKGLVNVASRISRTDDGAPEESIDIGDLIIFEETSLRNALRSYETELRNIYYKYATICDNEEIKFSPVLIRMFLWQLYYDCNIHKKGLTLVQIDRFFFHNPDWIARSAHNPFEKIYYWQFLHSLITVAQELYAKRHFPGTKPDTILASAFRTFMDNDILPGINSCKGYLVNGYGGFVPLKALYQLYRSIGEPHTIRAFLCATRHPAHDTDHSPPKLLDAADEGLPLGRNAYVIGDEMTFVIDDFPLEEPYDEANVEQYEEKSDLKLFNFSNLSSKTVIKIFAQIFPTVLHDDKIMNLDIELTFYEFFEAFIACTKESIRLKEVEMRWLEQQWLEIFNQRQEEATNLNKSVHK